MSQVEIIPTPCICRPTTMRSASGRLHGWGERGDDGYQPTRVGLGPAMARAGEPLQAVVVMPQMPRRVWHDDAMRKNWSTIDGSSPRDLNAAIRNLMATFGMALVDAVLAATLDELSIDETRMMLTGLSMGGFGAWHYATSHPSRFARVLVVCGGGDATLAPGLAGVPFRFHHGAADRTVPSLHSRRLVQALVKAGGAPIHREYPRVRHDAWTRTYRDPEVMAWLMAER